MTTDAKKQPTVFILYVPGGAMLGIIPALTVSRLESLTETPVQELFQVIEGVSTGSILAGGFNIPGMTARKGAELFVQFGPQFFPDMPGRWAKMYTRQGMNTGKALFKLDPKYADRLALSNIHKLAAKMRDKADLSIPGILELLTDFEATAKKEWLSRKDQRQLLEIALEINELDPELEKYTEAVAELVATRSFTSKLGQVFRQAAGNLMDMVKNKWAQEDECLFDPQVPKRIYQNLLGDRKISNSIVSTYISAYDIINNRVVTFSSLKKDLFSKDPNAPATVKNDIKFWDAIMASTANEFAYKAHITENNILCADKAPFHKPRSVKDVLDTVPKGTRVVLVIAGTGKYLSNDLLDFMHRKQEGDENLSEEELYRKKLEHIRDVRAEFGIAGNLMLGRELAELEAYTTSDALDDFEQKLGKENIFELTPRLAPYTPQEEEEFPSRDVLDASRENIKKIIKSGRKLIEEEDEQFRQLAQIMVDNLHLLGQMDDQKYARICEKIGLKTFDPSAEIEKETAGIENRIPSNDNSKGITRVWRALTRRIFRSGDTAPVRPTPRGPGES